MIKSDTPNLWEIRTLTNHSTAIAIIVTALIHLSRLVNLDSSHNLTQDQIGEIANDVLEEYGYLKPEEVKYLLKRAVRRNEIFGRLDYSVVMRWFADYDAIRTEFCIDLSDQNNANKCDITDDSKTYEEYVAQLQKEADKGDENAQAILSEIGNINRIPKLLTKEEKHQKDLEFFRWKNLIYNKGKWQQETEKK